MSENLTVAASGGGRLIRVGTAAVAAIALLLVMAAPAAAVFNPVSGGSTSLDLSTRFNKRLKNHEAKLRGLAPIKKASGDFTMPVDDGSLNPVSGAATIRHVGGFKLTDDGHRVRLRNPELKLGSDPRVDVNVGARGTTVRFLTLQGGIATAAGFGATVTNLRASLTGRAAKIINRALDEKVVGSGRQIGTLSTVPGLKRIAVAGGQTTLAASTQFLSRLNVGPQPCCGPISAAPLPPANVISLSPPTFQFPISFGSVSPTLDVGEVFHSGGIRLSRPPHPATAATNFRNRVDMADLQFNFGPPNVDATVTLAPFTQPEAVVRTNVATIDTSTATVAVNPAAHTITISGATAVLGEATAGNLNQLFGPPIYPNPPMQPAAFMSGDVLGTATLVTAAK